MSGADHHGGLRMRATTAQNWIIKTSKLVRSLVRFFRPSKWPNLFRTQFFYWYSQNIFPDMVSNAKTRVKIFAMLIMVL